MRYRIIRCLIVGCAGVCRWGKRNKKVQAELIIPLIKDGGKRRRWATRSHLLPLHACAPMRT